MTTKKARPLSFHDNQEDTDDEDKKKKRWTLKLFKSEDPSKAKASSDGKLLPPRGKVQGLFRTNSGEVSELHDKIYELESQLESYKHTRIHSFDKKVSVHHHQKLALDSSNWKDFRFKGVIFVKNRLGADIETIEVVPDLVDFMVNGNEPFLKQAILNLDLSLAAKGGLDITTPRTISFFYYLQHKTELRYDYLFNIHLQPKSVQAEMKDFVETRSKDGPDNGNHNNNTFEVTDFCNGHEIKTKIQAMKDSEGNYVPILKEFIIQLPMSSSKTQYREVSDPIFSSKSLQNFWFNLEVIRTFGDSYSLGPFSPSDQFLSLDDSHYFIEQEIILPGISVLGFPAGNDKKVIDKSSPHDHVFTFNYYVRDKAHEDSAIFCICSVEVSLAEIVRCSQGSQKLGDRFKMEKQLGLGMVAITFHFCVGEELIPEPVLTGQPLNPLCGYWLLERVTIGIRV